MPDMSMEIRRNKSGLLARAFPVLTTRGVRKQTEKTGRRMRANIVAAGSVDTGKMLGSVEARMVSSKIGEVRVIARSKQGFPYPVANNGGWHDRAGNYHPGKHWADKTRAESEADYAVTMRDEILGGL